MDLSTVRTTTRRVEFVLENDRHTGLFLDLRYESAKEVQKVHRSYENKLQETYMRGKRGKAERRRAGDEFKDNRMAAHVAGWEWLKDGDGEEATLGGEKPEFNKENLAKVLGTGELGVMLKKFIEEEIGDAENFIES